MNFEDKEILEKLKEQIIDHVTTTEKDPKQKDPTLESTTIHTLNFLENEKENLNLNIKINERDSKKLLYTLSFNKLKIKFKNKLIRSLIRSIYNITEDSNGKTVFVKTNKSQPGITPEQSLSLPIPTQNGNSAISAQQAEMMGRGGGKSRRKYIHRRNTTRKK
jgi:hypothetical protein